MDYYQFDLYQSARQYTCENSKSKKETEIHTRTLACDKIKIDEGTFIWSTINFNFLLFNTSTCSCRYIYYMRYTCVHMNFTCLRKLRFVSGHFPLICENKSEFFSVVLAKKQHSNCIYRILCRILFQPYIWICKLLNADVTINQHISPSI